MAQLILIKHARPVVDPARPSHEWKLSDEGRLAAKSMAEKLRPRGIVAVVTSIEPKASQTGTELAGVLGCKATKAEGLHEHDRTGVPHLPSAEFVSMMALMFQRPSERVLGRESADEATQRIDTAVRGVLVQHPDQTVAIVSHGTVIALFAAAHAKVDGYRLWREMGLPSYLVFDAESLELVDKVARV